MKVTITIPAPRLNNPDVYAAVISLTRRAGGCTLVNAQGLWCKPGTMEIQKEHVLQAEFCFSGGQKEHSGVDQLVRSVAKALIAVGEHTVMVDYQRNLGHTVHFYTLEDFL